MFVDSGSVKYVRLFFVAQKHFYRVELNSVKRAAMTRSQLRLVLFEQKAFARARNQPPKS